MAYGYARSAGQHLVDHLRETLIAAWYEMEDKNELPTNAEQYADSALHTVFDALSGGVATINRQNGLYPTDPRDPRNDKL
ncbi:hypothetical protein O4160_25680 [Rhodococcus sp. IEGM 1401]|uniref:Uncharacterized protein n=1 Tax=Rhodococcus cercidiphylli TaxID=489916 RepID=A0ABU4B3W9_9NOCA|nr:MULTISPECIES: hypothetical protein [Rhodococcus]MCZ4564232.1 hypothetical protein [Rhodococcus sp. IEGM 1401]MDI9924360.1 hypothetical protein [Rhodococcus sp. IEGM 1372]MDV6233153.1 hypothetical protein [Rhodococcus cercidiphylli]MDV8036810.1 hypothetical protein [Rhodococcus sp. IEGM 1414]MDV8077570.1 hypothetical protein [Rhodococcus sp. IEGM 1370]